MHSLFETVNAMPVASPRATRTNINAALTRYADLTPSDLRDYLAMQPDEIARLEALRRVLATDAIADLTKEGKVSFGMIKPHREEAIAVRGTDEEIADQVLAGIRSPLVVSAQQAIWIPTETTRSFYAHLPEQVLNRVAGFMSSGASTGLVLTDTRREAIREWRTQMGSTRAHENEAEKDSLRYRFQTTRGVENNVTHGSDSVESVQKELAFFREMLGVLTGNN